MGLPPPETGGQARENVSICPFHEGFRVCGPGGTIQAAGKTRGAGIAFPSAMGLMASGHFPSRPEHGPGPVDAYLRDPATG